MIKKMLYISLLFICTLHAATIKSNKELYSTREQIVATFDNMSGGNEDWIAIYPAGTTNDWGNVIQWDWIRGEVSGTKSFEALPTGTYDIRVFFNNSFNVEASTQINVDENGTTTVKTTKEVYLPDENITALFENMSGGNEDWIGIYPAGSTNDWKNMIEWKWIRGDISGMKTFKILPVGEYEVRVFFNNSFKMKATHTFRVEPIESEAITIALEKNIYDPFELLHVSFENMIGEASDWIGIFSIDANNTKESAIEWRDTKSLVNGELSFNGLPAGTYEARAYFNNIHKKTVPFTVQVETPMRILYDDFEDGIDPRWTKYFGKDMTLLNVGAIDGAVGDGERQVQINGQHALRTYNSDGLSQSSGYNFDFQNPDPKLKFLEIDMKIGVSSHRFAFGVKVKTKLGDRRIEFASWLNHTLPSGEQIIRGPYGNVLEGHRGAFVAADGYLHVHPGPTDYYVATSSVGSGSNMFVHYKINIEKKLRLIEPDNELLGISLFTTSGGDYDNLALTTE